MRNSSNLAVLFVGLLAIFLVMCGSPNRAPATLDPAVQATANAIYTENAVVAAELTGTAAAPTATRLNLQEAVPTETATAADRAIPATEIPVATDEILVTLPSATPTAARVATKIPTSRPATKASTRAPTQIVVQPTPVPAPQNSGRYVASSQARKYYYCVTDPQWKGLKAALIWSNDEATFQKMNLVLHRPC